VPDRAHDHVAILTPAGDNVIGVMVHDGKARIDALAPGPYLALWRATLQPFAIARDAATDLVLRPQPRATCALALRETDARKAERPRDDVEVDVLDAGGRLLDRVQLFERNRAGDSWPCEVLAAPGPVTVVVRIEGHERARRTLVLRAGAEIALD
jgi:hypothetical protein